MRPCPSPTYLCKQKLLVCCSGQKCWMHLLPFSHPCIQPTGEWMCLCAVFLWVLTAGHHPPCSPWLHHLMAHPCGPSFYSASTPACPQALNTDLELPFKTGVRSHLQSRWSPMSGENQSLRLAGKVPTWPGSCCWPLCVLTPPSVGSWSSLPSTLPAPGLLYLLFRVPAMPPDPRTSPGKCAASLKTPYRPMTERPSSAPHLFSCLLP